MIAKNIAHFRLPDDKKAIIDLSDAHNSISTSSLSVGDCVVAYVVPAPDQCEIPWVVSKVKHVMGKAAPAEIHAKTATATCSSHRLKEVLQQCVLEEEVDTVLGWHKVLSKKLEMSFESLVGCFNDLPKEAQKYTLQAGGPRKVLEQYPTLFHFDNVRGTVCLVECSPMDREVFRSDQIAKKTIAYFQAILTKMGPSTLGPLPGQHLNQEQVVCDSSGLPTATVHPMTPPSVNNNVPCADGSSDDVYTQRGSIVMDQNAKALHSAQPNVTATHHVDLTSASRALHTGVQEDLKDVRIDPQVSHTSTAEDGYSLPPSSVDISSDSSQGLQGTKNNVWAGSNPSLGQGWPLQLLGTEDGAGVWADSRKQDEQSLEAVCQTKFVVPGANASGYDDFTSLLPMFKDILRPIQDNLVEVEMDIGRIPIARYYNPQSPLLAAIRLSEQTLTRETLETILFALPLERSAIGQGRVLLRGSLHWISTLKNSLGEVVGLTLRRGQAVPGCLDLLWDVVTSGTSTLIVGRPCSGKTTLLREWARVLSDVCYRRVIVVDTLNEIAGGDDIPHPGIGGARRVQVHNRCEQVSQLQTAARNHSPDCIIVDEVQTQEEVTALQAIRLTGIQVVAGVCAGCLPDLLHNSVMRGLLGLSDPPSSTSAPLGVSQQPLTFPQTLPVFQAAVTIHNRETVSVYPDIASFVRVWLLEGRFPLAQHRKRVVTRDRETEL
ncbi:uncharacterized protein [Branchiostoma lanceolatum]|uniref:uncharacterized protein n=1 Tax=Branchiostoma lanceolatum TaxID=7740 RepID=UPI0034557B61